MLKTVILASGLMFAASAFSDTISFAVGSQMKAKIILKRVSANSGIYQRRLLDIKSKARVKIVKDGEVLMDHSEGSAQTKGASEDYQIILGSDSVVGLIDRTENEDGTFSQVDVDVNTQMKRRTFAKDKIKKFIIDGDDLRSIYKEEYEKLGIGQLRQLKVKVDQSEINIKFEMSDMECSVSNDQEIMTCLQDVTFGIRASGNE